MPASSAISRHVVGLATAAFALSVARPQVAFSQNVTRQNKCAVSESLKPTKTVVGTYTQEATRQNAEGIVVLWEILIRTNGSLSSVYRAVREQVRSVDPDQQVEGNGEVVSLEAIMTRQNEWQQARLATFLLGTFSLVALALASVGLYSVISYGVAQRTNEFGIRIALGAQRQHVLRLVLASAAASIGSGVAAGILLSFYSAKLVAQGDRLGCCWESRSWDG